MLAFSRLPANSVTENVQRTNDLKAAAQLCGTDSIVAFSVTGLPVFTWWQIHISLNRWNNTSGTFLKIHSNVKVSGSSGGTHAIIKCIVCLQVFLCILKLKEIGHTQGVVEWKRVGKELAHFFHVFICGVMKVHTSLNTDLKMSLKYCWKWLVSWVRFRTSIFSTAPLVISVMFEQDCLWQ